MRPTKGFGLLLAFSMALGIMATTPGIAAASTYSRDGGSPATCPTPYTVLKSATKNVGSGYIKVEMVYCSAWTVVWTRAYNYTGATAWFATGVVRTVNGSVDNRYDYTNGSCPTFCIDSLGTGTKSYGAQLYWPSSVPILTFTSTAYYCTSKSPSACGTSVSVTGSPAGSGAVIANVATHYLGYGPCGLGGPGFVSPTGAYTCPAGNPLPGWCDEFAGFVWAYSGVVNTSGLTPGPIGFKDYAGTLSSTPQVGDVAVMSDPGYPVYSHVAIVTAIDSNGRVTMVGGNEGGGAGIVAVSYWTPGASKRTITPDDGKGYWVIGYSHFR